MMTKLALFLILTSSFILDAKAASATWNLSPTSGDWNTAANWTPASIPNGPEDTATFNVSNITGITARYPLTLEVNGIVFEPGASAYTISSWIYNLTISGVGITNNSGIVQNLQAGATFIAPGSIVFSNNATAGTMTVFTNVGGDGSGDVGQTIFSDTSSAGNATFINNAAENPEDLGGATYFSDSSTAADGTFTNNAGTCFECAGGQTDFSNTSTAGNATLIDGGTIRFYDDSTGGTAQVELLNNGYLDFTFHNPPGVTIGSLQGDGTVSLGPNNLTIGSNNLSTTFSGVMGASGSVTKIGTGTLTLSGANTYTGGTIVEGGRLLVNNMTASGTGTGSVQVNSGTLSGRGTIAGPVSVGSGAGPGAVLTPGRAGGKSDTLTIQSTVSFNSGATYEVEFRLRAGLADKVVANGAIISAGARFSFIVPPQPTLAPGTVFTVIENTAATPITGVFSNLPDGSTLTVGENTFQANYEGGDGNDLTLTVIP